MARSVCQLDTRALCACYVVSVYVCGRVDVFMSCSVCSLCVCDLVDVCTCMYYIAMPHNVDCVCIGCGCIWNVAEVRGADVCSLSFSVRGAPISPAAHTGCPAEVRVRVRAYTAETRMIFFSCFN